MKKLLINFLVLIISLSFCSCNKSDKVTAVTSGLVFEAETEYKENCFNYFVYIHSDGTTETELLNNGESTGLKTMISKNSVTLSASGLEKQTSLTSLPDGIILDFFAACYQDAKERDVKTVNDTFYTEGKTKKYDYKIILGATGLPIKIEESNFGISVDIKNATLKADD